ncbi:MAG: hypothetical protein V1916_00045, partial [Patescibacteria group bacterium]
MPKAFRNLKRGQRWMLIGALGFFAFQLALPALIIPHQVRAIPTEVVADAPKTIWDILSKVLKQAGDAAFKNLLTSFLNNLAYNTANSIATGEKGQKPLFPTQPGELLTQAADVAAGDFLDQAINMVGKTGQCLGYSGISCGTDKDCEAPVLICPDYSQYFGQISLGKLSSYIDASQHCDESQDKHDACLAALCTVEQLQQVEDAANVNAGDAFFQTVGFPKCISGSFSLCDATAGNELLRLRINIMARQA